MCGKCVGRRRYEEKKPKRIFSSTSNASNSQRSPTLYFFLLLVKVGTWSQNSAGRQDRRGNESCRRLRERERERERLYCRRANGDFVPMPDDLILKLLATKCESYESVKSFPPRSRDELREMFGYFLNHRVVPRISKN